MKSTKNHTYYESKSQSTKIYASQQPQMILQDEPNYNVYPSYDERMGDDYQDPNCLCVDETGCTHFRPVIGNEMAKQLKFHSLPFNPETNAFSVSVIPNKPVRYLTICEPYIEPIQNDTESNYYSFYFETKPPKYTYKPYKQPQRGVNQKASGGFCFIPDNNSGNAGCCCEQPPYEQMEYGYNENNDNMNNENNNDYENNNYENDNNYENNENGENNDMNVNNNENYYYDTSNPQ